MRKIILMLLVTVSISCWAQQKATDSSTALQANNPELEKLYNEDQADRTGGHMAAGADERDAGRRKQVLALIDAGKVQTGDDYFHAAMVFQHGQGSADILRAHQLAVLAAAKGSKGAIWLTAATLDRYLQRIGQPQIFGTQYQRQQNQPWTMEPYDRSMSDAMRAQFNVPPLAKQEEQLKKMNEQK